MGDDWNGCGCVLKVGGYRCGAGFACVHAGMVACTLPPCHAIRPKFKGLFPPGRILCTALVQRQARQGFGGPLSWRGSMGPAAQPLLPRTHPIPGHSSIHILGPCPTALSRCGLMGITSTSVTSRLATGRFLFHPSWEAAEEQVGGGEGSFGWGWVRRSNAGGTSDFGGYQKALITRQRCF